MKKLFLFFALLLSITIIAQNKSLTDDPYYTVFYLSDGDAFTGATEMLNDDNGTGTFDDGTYVYSFNENNNIILVEDINEMDDDPAYIGSVDSSGEYCILIGDPAFAVEGKTAIASMIKMSSGKTNASFSGNYITSYFRYTNSSSKFAGLFSVNADGIDSCVYEFIMGTENIEDEGFDYEISDGGIAALSNSDYDSVIMASINASEDAYQFALDIYGSAAIGYGVKIPIVYDIESNVGTYKAIQIRYSASNSKEVTSLLTLEILPDSTGTYTVDTSSSDASTSGTLKAVSQTNGIWEIVLDNDTDYTLYCALNPNEKLMTGYFNYRGESPGIIFAIPYAETEPEPTLPTYTISGTLTNANNGVVYVYASGDITATDTLKDGDTNYSFEVDSAQSVTITPECVAYDYDPVSISIANISSDTVLQHFNIIIKNALQETQNTDVSVYPNPVTSQLTIEAPAYSHIELLDLNGKVLERVDSKTLSPYHINLNTREAGVYLIRVSNAKGVCQHKVVKY